MRKFLLASVALFSFTTAYAADIPVKAPVVPPPALSTTACTPEHCTGLYMGFNVSGVATNANVLANGINGSVAGGGESIGGQGGFQFWNGTWFFGGEVFGDYTVGGSPIIAGANKPTYLFGEVVKVGTPLSTFFGSVAPANTSGLPALLTANTISPYIFTGACERSWATGICSGAGVTFAIDQQHWFLDARYINIQYTGSDSVNAVQSISQENLIQLGLNYKF
jgi:hypothetical protein